MRSSIRLLLGATAIALLPFPVRGCECAPAPTVGESREEATLVFMGEVAEIRYISLPRDPGEAGAAVQVQRYVTFLASKFWKGRPVERVELVSYPSSACHYQFEIGRRYLVYAEPFVELDPLMLMASSCGRTRREEESVADQEALGEAVSAPAEDGSTRDPESTATGHIDMRPLRLMVKRTPKSASFAEPGPESTLRAWDPGEGPVQREFVSAFAEGAEAFDLASRSLENNQ